MKTIEDILNNYEEFETIIDDRFGKRFADFLTAEQVEKIGFQFKDEKAKKKHKPIPFTEENILKQLKADVEFGWEKARDRRGISANLMYYVVLSWCKVLENEFSEWSRYEQYGEPLFKAVAEKYGWDLVQMED